MMMSSGQSQKDGMAFLATVNSGGDSGGDSDEGGDNSSLSLRRFVGRSESWECIRGHFFTDSVSSATS